MTRKTAAEPASPADAPADDPVAKFEASLAELEAIVATMERGDLPLQESLTLFERGMSLTRVCRTSLETAELRVRTLLDASEPPADA